METFPESPAVRRYLLPADRLQGQADTWRGVPEAAAATSREAPR